MQLSKGHIAFAAACLVAGIIIGNLFRSCSHEPTDGEPIVLHDTITIHDTADIAAHTKPKPIIKRDTVYLPALEKDSVGDSVAVVIPRESYEYRDTFETDSSRIELGVQFSGWHAQIDGIDLKSQYTMQPRTIEKRRGFGWSVHVGPYVGYGATVIGNRVYAAPSVGVSVSVGWGYNWK